jgi:cytochrome c oxidase cbb3-type subunit 3
VLCACLAAASSCDREQSRFRDVALPGPAAAVSESALFPPGAMAAAGADNPYEDNAWAMSEGKRLFDWYNCSGCHARGGGGMGPALIDDVWIYGSEPAQIFATIVEGRPNGMPSFRGKVSETEVWKLVAFVRSLSGFARFDVAGGRDDHMQVKPAEQAMEEPQPKNVAEPR